VTPGDIATIVSMLLGSGAVGWALKLYGAQREHAGKLAVLEQALSSSRSDHDTVVRLDTDVRHMARQVEEVRDTCARIEQKLSV